MLQGRHVSLLGIADAQTSIGNSRLTDEQLWQ